ncbi:MAG: hypothetical protein ACK5MY_08455 [Jhaorihella sp.]
MEIPVGKPLLELLERPPKTAVAILATTNVTAWTESGFRASWRKYCLKTGVEGLILHDLRWTAVTRLAVAGCNMPEIAAIAGHGLKQVTTILDAHYLGRDSALGVSAIRKLEAAKGEQRSPTDFPAAKKASVVLSPKCLRRLVAEEGLEPPTRGL